VNGGTHLDSQGIGASPRRSLDEVTFGRTNLDRYGWSSQNWAGYALASRAGAFEAIGGNWTVPKVSVPGGGATGGGRLSRWLRRWFRALGEAQDLYSATWIGIDGFTGTQLIQVGTAQNRVAGRLQYYAWWEVLPNPETVIDPQHYPVNPGDQMTASISRQDDGHWLITLWNRTRGWVFVRTDIAYAGPGTSAEWIEEAPEVNGRQAELADFGQVTFSDCSVNGENARLDLSQAGVMVQQGQVVARPSAPGGNGTAFTVVYGASQPQPPTVAG
jgi:hypothetical protein